MVGPVLRKPTHNSSLDPIHSGTLKKWFSVPPRIRLSSIKRFFDKGKVQDVVSLGKSDRITGRLSVGISRSEDSVRTKENYPDIMECGRWSSREKPLGTRKQRNEQNSGYDGSTSTKQRTTPKSKREALGVVTFSHTTLSYRHITLVCMACVRPHSYERGLTSRVPARATSRTRKTKEYLDPHQHSNVQSNTLWQ